ncbi:MAG TPA: hypothetical protein DCE41_21110 [Cytophagales bacterium]|nr:hypothetical protein [Cytophagales bacterium]HAA20784.1 hypothetical protein [Cytophagales bacterium]
MKPGRHLLLPLALWILSACEPSNSQQDRVSLEISPSDSVAVASNAPAEPTTYAVTIASVLGSDPLYRNCINALQANLSELEDKGVQWFVTGGQIIPGRELGQAEVVPDGNEITVGLRQSVTIVGKATFTVVPPPPPQVAVYIRGNQVASLSLATARETALEVVVKPNDDFRKLLPQDSRYRIRKWTATLHHANGSLGSVSFNQKDGELAQLLTDAQPGMTLVVTPQEAQRLNGQNRVENIALSVEPITIPLE